jgi:hypothetical protein
VQDAFADPGEADEAEGLVERDGVGLGVSHDTDASDAVARIDGE